MHSGFDPQHCIKTNMVVMSVTSELRSRDIEEKFKVILGYTGRLRPPKYF